MATGKTRSKQGTFAKTEQFVTVKEAGAVIKKSEASIRRDLSNGVLRRFKQGGRTLIAMSDLLGTIREV
jgi:hypothetical protein